MRDFKGMKRQRSRNRNGGGNGGNGGGKPQQNANRAFDSNGPEGVKVRGAAQHVYEKYQQLARDATTAGDRVLAENYLQHAEHYFRMMRAMQPLRPVSEILGRDQFVSGFDIDFEDESGAAQVAEGEPLETDGQAQVQVQGEGFEASAERPYNAPRRDDYRRDEPRRDDNRYNDQRRDEGRQDEPRAGDQRSNDPRPNDQRQSEWRSREGGDRPARNNDRYNDRPREDRAPRAAREDRPRYNREDRAPREENDPLNLVEPQATPLTNAPSQTGPVLRADDGDVSHAPAFLQARPSEPKAETAEPRAPRRRRVAAPRNVAPAPDSEG
jgi:hypothetical protein